MAGKSIAARPASWRVLYVDSAGGNRVTTVKSQAEVDALVAELAGRGITAGVKATAAAWRARFVDDAGKEHQALPAEAGRPGLARRADQLDAHRDLRRAEGRTGDLP